MRTVFWQMMVSLDGLMEGPNHELDWHVWDADIAHYVADLENHIDTIVFGRVTYEMMAAYWPTSTEPEARMMNQLPKVVFSKTLKKVEWNKSRLAQGDVREEIERLKKQPGKDIAVFGSANLASTLARLGLIDEYRFFINPLVLGRGTPVLRATERTALKLVKTQTLSSGVVLLCYQPR